MPPAGEPGAGDELRAGSPEPRNLARDIGIEPEDEAVVGALLALGVSSGAIRRAFEHGRIENAIFDAVLDPARGERTVTPHEIEAGGGLAVAQIEDLVRAFGLPAPEPDEAYFTPQEGRVLTALGRELGELWPPSVHLPVARVYGDALSHIAEVETVLFRSHVERALHELSQSPLENLAAVRGALEQLLPLADPMLLGVHRRKVEHELTQAAVREVELRGEGAIPGEVEVCLLFCDLTGFTAYADARGDEAAIEAIDRFAEAVAEHRGEHGRLVKRLGDGYMLAYPTPAEALPAAARLFASAHEMQGLRLHASVHHGVAVFREGDYFGRAVNLAARLLAAAGPGELLATRAVADATAAEYGWQSRGAERLRGLAEPVDVYSLLLHGAS